MRAKSGRNIFTPLFNTIIAKYVPRTNKSVLLARPTIAAPITLYNGIRIKHIERWIEILIPFITVFVVCLSDAFKKLPIRWLKKMGINEMERICKGRADSENFTP